MQTRLIILPLAILFLSGCATGRDMTSKHYLPEWENHILNFPNPSSTSAGYWAKSTAHQVSHRTEQVILFPFAVLGNIAVNAYMIPTWPFRWAIRGDKRLIVWYPLFHVGEEMGSPAFSKQWNDDLT